MKPSYWLPLAAAVAAGSVAAQSPPPKPTGGTSVVLLLTNYRVVEAEQVGDEYHVRRGKDVVKIPEQQVIFAGDSRDAVQRYLMTRTKPPTPTGSPTPGGFNSAALRGFPTKAQPVLMNLCAGCHASPGHPGEFKLDRVREGYANPEASRRNAETVTRFVSRDEPGASPLLEKAVTAHGGQKLPALKDRTQPAYQTLELWVHWAAGAEGSPIPTTVPAPKPKAVMPSPSVPPSPTPVSGDPYDPTAFNRAAHPKR